LKTISKPIKSHQGSISHEEYARACLGLSPSIMGYSTQSDKLRQFGDILQQNTLHLLPDYNRYLLCWLLSQFDIDNGQLDLPDSVKSLYPAQLKRIEDQLEELEPDFFSFNNDPFVKDVAILTHRLIPVGAEYVSPNSGIPRSIVLKGGFCQFCNATRYLLKAGGTKPFLELHMHILDASEFHPDGWIRTYERLADLLERNLSYRGVQSTSWFLDPQLENISPHLAYLRTVPLSAGAQIFFMGLDKEGDSGALAKSKKRKALFEHGLYTPRLFTRIWPRRSVLERGWR